MQVIHFYGWKRSEKFVIIWNVLIWWIHQEIFHIQPPLFDMYPYFTIKTQANHSVHLAFVPYKSTKIEQVILLVFFQQFTNTIAINYICECIPNNPFIEDLVYRSMFSHINDSLYTIIILLYKVRVCFCLSQNNRKNTSLSAHWQKGTSVMIIVYKTLSFLLSDDSLTNLRPDYQISTLYIIMWKTEGNKRNFFFFFFCSDHFDIL